ncbi:MAG: VapE domain-containing protein, partial [Acidobacteriaceae bacterium]
MDAARVVLVSANEQDAGFLAKHKAKVIQHPASLPGEMICKADGSLVPCLQNAVHILETEQEWVGRLKLDEFAQVILFDGKPVEDVDASEINLSIGRSHGGAQFKTPIICEALAVAAHRHATHPVRDYLSGLAWDKTPRLDTWLSDAFDCPQTEYTRAVGANTIISAVARIMRPGCQVDTMLILEGNQGIGKSKALRNLFGIGWYTETTEKPGTKDFYQALRGKWCLELAELDSLRGADISRVKQVLSATSDNY